MLINYYFSILIGYKSYGISMLLFSLITHKKMKKKMFKVTSNTLPHYGILRKYLKPTFAQSNLITGL